MATFIGNTYVGGRIEIDGHTYKDCTFNGCTIIYAGGNASLDGGTMNRCAFKFVGCAGKTLAFLQSINRNKGGGDLVASAFPLNFTIEKG